MSIYLKRYTKEEIAAISSAKNASQAWKNWLSVSHNKRFNRTRASISSKLHSLKKKGNKIQPSSTIVTENVKTFTIDSVVVKVKSNCKVSVDFQKSQTILTIE